MGAVAAEVLFDMMITIHKMKCDTGSWKPLNLNGVSVTEGGETSHEEPKANCLCHCERSKAISVRDPTCFRPIRIASLRSQSHGVGVFDGETA
jgi:hypothetical protein